MTGVLYAFLVFAVIVLTRAWWIDRGRTLWQRWLAASACPDCGKAYGSCRCVYFGEEREYVFVPEDNE